MDIRKISNNGTEVKGVIFEIGQTAGNNNNISYPIVRFLTLINEWITKSSRTGGLPGIYKKGEEITVVYQTNNPNNFLLKQLYLFDSNCHVCYSIVSDNFWGIYPNSHIVLSPLPTRCQQYRQKKIYIF